MRRPPIHTRSKEPTGTIADAAITDGTGRILKSGTARIAGAVHRTWPIFGRRQPLAFVVAKTRPKLCIHLRHSQELR